LSAKWDTQRIVNDMMLGFSAVSTIDTSGVSLFKDLKNALTMKGVSVSTLKMITEVHR